MPKLHFAAELGTLTACHFAGNVLESRVILAVDKAGFASNHWGIPMDSTYSTWDETQKARRWNHVAWDFPATAHKKGAGEKQNSQTKHDKTMFCYVLKKHGDFNQQK